MRLNYSGVFYWHVISYHNNYYSVRAPTTNDNLYGLGLVPKNHLTRLICQRGSCGGMFRQHSKNDTK
jgi:hypothetical protein